jgi:molecular chaperone DnaK (HSP70)
VTPTSSSDSSTAEPTPGPQTRTKFIIGLDYGTTFSSVSYINFDPANPPQILRGEQIKSVSNWPDVDSRASNITEVPSESWYLDNEFYWGYGARKAIIGIEDDNLNYKNRIIQYAKLLIPGTQPDTRGPRRELRRTLVKARKDEAEVSKDYLRQVLKHSKQFLQEREGFSEDCEVELVFCVPAGWPAKASRTMQEILLDIMTEIRLGVPAPLFVLNEPEAAAAYILEALPRSADLTVSSQVYPKRNTMSCFVPFLTNNFI